MEKETNPEPDYECDYSDWDIAEIYAMLNQVWGEAGWDDPAMDIYNDYDANLRKLNGD